MDGIILIDKEKNISSFKVVEKARKILNIKKIGHAGTLDPLAEGLLILLVGKATKFFQRFLSLEKEYIFEVTFGIKTATGDSEGEILEKREVLLEKEDIVRIIPSFLGEIKQKVPLFSAVKIKGQKAYKIARSQKSKNIELPERSVKIFQLELLDFQKEAFPKARFRALVSSGTYIRSLGEDIGKALNVPAFVSFLRRTKIGFFDVEKAIKISELEKIHHQAIIPLYKLKKLFKEPFIVIDTNVYLAAYFNKKSASFKILNLIFQKKCFLVLSKELTQELENILSKVKPDINFYNKIADLFKIAFFVENLPHLEVVKEDKGDNKFLEVAQETEADFLITSDQHLLQLKEFRGTKILSPEDFLKTFLAPKKKI